MEGCQNHCGSGVEYVQYPPYFSSFGSTNCIVTGMYEKCSSVLHVTSFSSALREVEECHLHYNYKVCFGCTSIFSTPVHHTGLYIDMTNFDVLLTVHLSIFISVFNKLDAQNLFHNKFYFMPLHVSSTCAQHQEVKIALHSL